MAGFFYRREQSLPIPGTFAPYHAGHTRTHQGKGDGTVTRPAESCLGGVSSPRSVQKAIKQFIDAQLSGSPRAVSRLGQEGEAVGYNADPLIVPSRRWL